MDNMAPTSYMERFQLSSGNHPNLWQQADKLDT